MITEEKLNEMFLKYETKEFSFEDIVKQLKNILSELAKEASEGKRKKFIKITVSLDQNLDNYIDAFGDAEIHLPGADDKLKRIEYILREVIGRTKFVILDNLKKQRCPVEITLPISRSSVPILYGKSYSDLRQKNGVRELHHIENELNITKLPNGVYGFVTPWGVGSHGGVEAITLSRSAGGTVCMEIHKNQNGDIFVSGFVSEDVLIQLQDTTRNSKVEIILFTEKYEGFDKLVAIPIERILSINNRDVESIYVIDMAIL